MRSLATGSLLRFLWRLYLISVGINYIWEMAQMPLYQDMPFDQLSSWLICFRASLGDGLIIAAIWAAGFAVCRSEDWFRELSPAKVTLLILAGGVIAVAIEIYALDIGRWAYSSLMPVLPLFGVGLSPFVQLLILPWPIMLLARSR